MSILIKGMKMPKNCGDCLTNYMLNVVCDCDLNNIEDGMRLPNCPLVELPPHGRLIDADELMGEIQDYIEEYSWYTDEHGFHSDKWCAMKETEMAINDAPTIVEADNNTQNMSAESEGEE